jgi:hypothetical protein
VIDFFVNDVRRSGLNYVKRPWLELNLEAATASLNEVPQLVTHSLSAGYESLRARDFIRQRLFMDKGLLG